MADKFEHDDHDENLEPGDEKEENTDWYDPNDPGHDDDDHAEEDPDKGKVYIPPQDPEKDYPNDPVTGPREPAEWTVTGDMYQDGTSATVYSNVGIKCFVRASDKRIMQINRVHVRKGPNLEFNENSIFIVHTSYPFDHPKVIRPNGSESPPPIEAEKPLYSDDPRKDPDPEHELGKRPQPRDPDDDKPSEIDPDSEDQSKPE